MKKILGFFVAAAVLCAFGCSKPDEGDANATAGGGTTTGTTSDSAATTTGGATTTGTTADAGATTGK